MGPGGIRELAVPGQWFSCVKVLVAALAGLAPSFIDATQQRPISFVHLAVAGHKKTGKSQKSEHDYLSLLGHLRLLALGHRTLSALSVSIIAEAQNTVMGEG
jgi:hypothetical protein